jgi:hypothetical protein
MAHIITEYEKNLGVKRGKPEVNKQFFPLEHHEYILICNSGRIPAKKYSYYYMVLDLLKDFCNSRGIKIYQIGEESELINGVDNFFGNLSFKQVAYLISKAMVFVCADGVYSQYASSQKIPLVNLFGNVYSSVTEGAWPGPKFNIEPKWKVKPSFLINDPLQSINSIRPEAIASCILKAMNFTQKVNFKTLHIGDYFEHPSIHVVPTDYQNLKIFEGKILNLRLDYGCKQEALLQYCLNHKCNLVLKDLIVRPNQLQSFAQNIKKITILLSKMESKVDPRYFEVLKKLGIDYDILVTDKEILNDVRLEYFDENVELYTPILKRPEGISEGSHFFSLKKVIEGSACYPSKAHWKEKQIPLDKKIKIIDNSDYWEDLEYFYIYEQN